MNTEKNPKDAGQVLGPGKLLQIAREEKNLRPEDIAYEIRLTPSQVVALDEDDYSNMPEETYIRGYLRNYARLVGVAENDILMAFARFTRARDATPVPANVPDESETGNNSRPVLILAVASIIAVIVLSAVWVMEPDVENSTAENSTAENSTELAAVDQKISLDEVPVGSSTLDLDKSAAETALNVAPISPQSGSQMDPDTKSELTEAAPDKTVDIDQSVDTTIADSEQSITDGGVLILNYSKDSWTDVRDVNGNKLLYRTVKAGEKIALAGELPISLFFGFAQGVTVKFNGKTIDVQSHTRGVFARFTVGEDANQ